MENTSDSFMPRPLLFCLKSERSVCYSVPDNNKRKEECELYKIVWRNEYADFGVVPISNTCTGQYPIGFSYGKTLHGRDYKSVGNIFDNPELLEVE